MSFKCDNCDAAQEPGVRPQQLVTDFRVRSYGDIPGWEIRTAKNVCQPCADLIVVPMPPPRVVR